MLKVKIFHNYLNNVDRTNLHFVSGWSTKKEHIDNTFNLYFENIGDKSIFKDDQINELKSWFLDIAKLHQSKSNVQYPEKNNFQTEAIKFNNQIILKECFNLLHLITNYHNAYILKTENEDELKDTFYHISQDKQEIRKKYNKFDKESEKYRESKEYRAPFILLKKVLKLLLSDQYKFRANYYIYSIALNYEIINWNKLFEDANDEKAIEIFQEVLHYLMYKNISETRIKNSLMTLVYTFLTKRLFLKEKDALDLTNRLAHDILYDLDNKNDYRKSELSKNIYINSVFNYLPIFAYQNTKYKPKYTKEQEEKISNTIKKQALQVNKQYKFIDDQLFIDSFNNSHIDYVMHDLIFLYNSKEE